MGVSAEEVLRLGAVAWLEWRGQHSQIPDLSDAQLMGLNLRGADLHDVDLRRSNLSETKLVAANLSGACLSNAILNRADLIDANLQSIEAIDFQAIAIAFTPDRSASRRSALVKLLPMRLASHSCARRKSVAFA